MRNAILFTLTILTGCLDTAAQPADTTQADDGEVYGDHGPKTAASSFVLTSVDRRIAQQLGIDVSSPQQDPQSCQTSDDCTADDAICLGHRCILGPGASRITPDAPPMFSSADIELANTLHIDLGEVSTKLPSCWKTVNCASDTAVCLGHRCVELVR